MLRRGIHCLPGRESTVECWEPEVGCLLECLLINEEDLPGSL